MKAKLSTARKTLEFVKQAWYGCGFVVNDWTPLKTWPDKEYMKEGKANEANYPV